MTRIAVLQMTSGIDPAANAATIVQAIANAKAGGAAMLFTPEMSGLLDRDRARAKAAIRREEDDAVLTATREAAQKHGLWVQLGSLAIDAGRADGRYANRGFVIDGRGAIVARYDKIHLFDVDVGPSESWRESNAYAPGESAKTADTPVGRMGLSICYDLRFPALYQALSDAGATILSIPAAFTVPTGQAHWHVLMRARAIENACYVVAAAQVGVHEDGRTTYGHSIVVDPWGKVLLDLGEAAGLGFCDLPDGAVEQVRQRIPVIVHRRGFEAA